MITDFLDSIPAYLLEKSKNLELNLRSVNGHVAIDDVLSRTVLRGGKRLRPLLTYLMGNLFEIDLDQVTPFARASELVHAASLSHDDVIDNATLRRGSPSINILASNKKAILAGDYLLSSVIVDLCRTKELTLVQEMSLVIKDLSEGEWLQLDLISGREYTRELIREIALKKTSSIMSYCTVAPAILAKMPDDIQGLSRQFGISLGLAFQLIDDTLDYSTDSLKDSELDLKNGVVNAVVFEYLNENSNLMERFKKGENLEALLSGKNLTSSVEKVSCEAQNHLENARNVLSALENYLSLTIYKNRSSKLENAIEHLQLIISYMALRQS